MSRAQPRKVITSEDEDIALEATVAALEAALDTLETALDTMVLYAQDENDPSTHGAEFAPMGTREDWEEVNKDQADQVAVAINKTGAAVSGSGRYVVIIILICAVTFLTYTLIQYAFH